MQLAADDESLPITVSVFETSEPARVPRSYCVSFKSGNGRATLAEFHQKAAVWSGFAGLTKNGIAVLWGTGGSDLLTVYERTQKGVIIAFEIASKLRPEIVDLDGDGDPEIIVPGDVERGRPRPAYFDVYKRKGSKYVLGGRVEYETIHTIVDGTAERH